MDVRTRKLEMDFVIKCLQIKNFWGTEAAFRFAIIAYKLMSLFYLM
jgi:hypothetical protein